MNKIYTFFIFLIITSYSVTGFSDLHEPYIVKNNVSGCVNVRPEPKTSSSAFTCLTAGIRLTVIKAIPYWREILFNEDQRGWIAKKFIEPSDVSITESTSTSIPEDAFLKVHFIDVGQGDAILIQTHDDGIDGNGRFEGYSIVIDGGIYSRDDDNPLRSYIEDPAHHVQR